MGALQFAMPCEQCCICEITLRFLATQVGCDQKISMQTALF